MKQRIKAVRTRPIIAELNGSTRNDSRSDCAAGYYWRRPRRGRRSPSHQWPSKARRIHRLSQPRLPASRRNWLPHKGVLSLETFRHRRVAGTCTVKFEDPVEEQWSGDGFSMAERDGVNRYKQEQSRLEDQGGHPWCPLPTSRARYDILKQLDNRGAIAPAEHVARMSVRFGYIVETQDFLL